MAADQRFRNILVHSYLGDIDAQTVQRVVQRYLAPLEKVIDSMLAEGDDGAGG